MKLNDNIVKALFLLFRLLLVKLSVNIELPQQLKSLTCASQTQHFLKQCKIWVLNS